MFIEFLIYFSVLFFALDFLAGSYMLPGMIATQRDSMNQDVIMLFNLLLGWTIIIWLVLLVWAMFGGVWAPADDDWNGNEVDNRSANAHK